jgi:hypothetical protein
MYNYNRDVANAEFERSERLSMAASRQVPVHLRVDNGKRLRGWLSAKVTGPARALASLVAEESARYWRRASSRAAGLATNAAKSLVPG